MGVEEAGHYKEAIALEAGKSVYWNNYGGILSFFQSPAPEPLLSKGVRKIQPAFRPLVSVRTS